MLSTWRPGVARFSCGGTEHQHVQTAHWWVPAGALPWCSGVAGHEAAPPSLSHLERQHRLQPPCPLCVRVGDRLGLAGCRHQALPLGAGALRGHPHLSLQPSKQVTPGWIRQRPLPPRPNGECPKGRAKLLPELVLAASACMHKAPSLVTAISKSCGQLGYPALISHSAPVQPCEHQASPHAQRCCNHHHPLDPPRPTQTAPVSHSSLAPKPPPVPPQEPPAAPGLRPLGPPALSPAP